MAQPWKKHVNKPVKRRGVFTILNGYITTRQVMQLFRRSELTVREWMFNDGLPYVVIPGDGRDTIRFVRREVTAWGRKNKRRMVSA